MTSWIFTDQFPGMLSKCEDRRFVSPLVLSVRGSIWKGEGVGSVRPPTLEKHSGNAGRRTTIEDIQPQGKHRGNTECASMRNRACRQRAAARRRRWARPVPDGARRRMCRSDPCSPCFWCPRSWAVLVCFGVSSVFPLCFFCVCSLFRGRSSN